MPEKPPESGPISQAAFPFPPPDSPTHAPVDPEPKSKVRKAPTTDDGEAKKKPRAPRGKTRKMDQAPGPPPAAAQRESDGESAGSELTIYQIKLAPGPDVLRRGINPLGVLDELRELGETSIVTDPELGSPTRPA